MSPYSLCMALPGEISPDQAMSNLPQPPTSDAHANQTLLRRGEMVLSPTHAGPKPDRKGGITECSARGGP